MKCYRKNGSDIYDVITGADGRPPSMKCYRKNGSDGHRVTTFLFGVSPSMKCYRKNGSDLEAAMAHGDLIALNEVLPKER